MRRRAAHRVWIVVGVVFLTAAALALGSASARSGVAGRYTVHNLNSNVPGLATHQDPDLQNGWGIAAADNGRPLVGGGQRRHRQVDAVHRPRHQARPRGRDRQRCRRPEIVFNGGAGFSVAANGRSGPGALHLRERVGDDQRLEPDRRNATPLGRRGPQPPRGLQGPRPRRRPPVGRSCMRPTSSATRSMSSILSFGPGDPPPVASSIPKLPAGYAPFGDRRRCGGCRGHLRQAAAPAARTSSTTRASGIVDAFDTDGNLISRIATHGQPRRTLGGLPDAPPRLRPVQR